MRCVLTASDCWQTANGAPTRASVVSGHTLKQGRRHAPYATAVGGFQGLQALSLHRWPPLGAFIKLPALRVVHDALRFFEQGRVVLCSDEKTGMQILERTCPPQPLAPGKPEKREYEYIRHGTRALIASFVVATGQVVWNLGQTRTSTDFATHLTHVVQQLPDMHRYDWVVDNLNTHWSLDVCRVVAQWCKVSLGTKDLSHGVQRRAFL